MTRRLVALVALALSMAMGAAAAPAPVAATARFDRSAMWLADQVTYTIDLVCAPGFDVLTDDLGRDRLKLEPLEVLDGRSTRTTTADGFVDYRFDYAVTTYQAAPGNLAVNGPPVRYYVVRAGQRLDQMSPAGAVQVPAATIVLRSLLPDNQPSYEPRETRDPLPRRLIFRALEPIGVGLLLLSIVPVVLAAGSVVRVLGTRPRGAAGPSRRRQRRALQSTFAELRDTDVSTPAARRAAFARLDRLVRESVTWRAHVSAAGLTTDELAAELATADGRMPAEPAGRVLRTCEIARFAPSVDLPGESAWRDALADAALLIESR